MPSFYPLARPSGLSVEAVGDELVIWDAERNHYHTLNATARAVWSLCDGQHALDDLPALLEFPAEVVGFAIHEFQAASLLALPNSEVSDSALVPIHLTRRQVVTRLAVAGALGAVALPIVGSITAVDVSAAISCTNPCTPGCPSALLCPCNPAQCNPCITNPCGVGCPDENSCTCKPYLCFDPCVLNPCADGCPPFDPCNG